VEQIDVTADIEELGAVPFAVVAHPLDQVQHLLAAVDPAALGEPVAEPAQAGIAGAAGFERQQVEVDADQPPSSDPGKMLVNGPAFLGRGSARIRAGQCPRAPRQHDVWGGWAIVEGRVRPDVL
jgi:hypothetical protein